MKTNDTQLDVKMVFGLDALYFQLRINLNDYTKFYINAKEKNIEKFQDLTILSYNWDKQYTFFEYSENGEQIAKIGFKHLNVNDGLEPIKIQVYTTYLNTYGAMESYYKIVEKIESLGLKVLGNKITEIDLNTYVYGYDFSYVEYKYFETLTKKHTNIFGESGKMETFYLGVRSNGKTPFLRIYNKWTELQSKDETQMKQALISYKFMKEHNISLDTNIPLWQVEWELKREYLRRWDINTIEDALKSVNIIHNDLMENNKLMHLAYNKTKEENKRVSPVWNKIKNEYNYNNSNLPRAKMKIPRHVKDERWLLKKIDEYLEENRVKNSMAYDMVSRDLEKLKKTLEVVMINNSIINNRLKKEKGEDIYAYFK